MDFCWQILILIYLIDRKSFHKKYFDDIGMISSLYHCMSTQKKKKKKKYLMMKFLFVVLLCIQLINISENFGHWLLNLFLLDRSSLNVNDGSYGSSPKSVHQKWREDQIMAKSNPHRWFRLEIQNRMKSWRETLSTHVHCHPDDLVWIENASTEINFILKSLKLSSNETILYTNVAFRMVKLTFECLSKELFREEQIIQIDLDRQSIQNRTLLLEKTQSMIDQMTKCEINYFWSD